MSKRSKSKSHTGAPRLERRMRWLSGSSMAAAAFLLASAPQAAQAQTQSMLRAPDFSPRDIRISAPLSPLPVNDVRISAPIARLPDTNIRISTPLSPLPVNDIRISAPVSRLPDADIRISAPIARPPVADVRISAPAPANFDPIRISVPVPGLVQAQAGATASGHAVNGNPVFTSGAGAFTPGTVTNNITGLTGQTIIDWTLVDQSGTGAISFLPDGNTLAFSGNADYTVLNRIVPTDLTRGIRFDGNVTSRILSNAGAQQGGNLWFYSPGGIVVGGNARFDVGSLLLTTNAIDTTGGLFGSAGEIRFRGDASSGAITIEPFLNDSPGTDQITANKFFGGDTYVAMVAPRVVQAGNVLVDGSVAYVAAEQADLTINNGLFDISIGVGTSDANGIVHTGSTIGLASTPTSNGSGQITDADARAIYMVAVPKNDAVTMLVGGTVGYLAASSATIDNGKIILSAGGNVTASGSPAAPVNVIEENTTSTAATNVQIGGTGVTAFGSTLDISASNDITISSQSAADRIFINNAVGAQDLNLTAGNQINLNTSAGGQILVNGDVNLTAGTGATGGTINIDIDRTGFGTEADTGLRVSGNLTADSSATGADDFFIVRNNGNTGIGEDATGGDITINITDGGVLVVGGNARFLTSAQGGKGEVQNGFGQAGNIAFNMDSGTARFGGNADFDARVRNASDGKIGGNGVGLLGSSSTAGDIDLNLSGGQMTVDRLGLTAYAIGSSGSDSATAQNNAATAGDIDLVISAGDHNIGSLDFSAFASGGSSFDAAGNNMVGDVTRASVNFAISNSGTNVSITDTIVIDATTNGNVLNDPAADAVTLSVFNTGGETGLFVSNAVDIYTSASSGGVGGALTAGSVSIVADNGVVNFDNLSIDTSIDLFSIGEMSALATAGNIDLIAQNGGGISGNSVNFNAYSNTESTFGINAVGGDVLLHANDGSIILSGNLSVDTNARGGVKDPAVSTTTNAQGGSVRILVEGTSSTSSRMSFADIDLIADGSIAAGVETTPFFEGGGGSGFGGSITFDLLGGTFTAGDIFASASGAGGQGGSEVTLPNGNGNEPTPDLSALAEPLDLSVVEAPMAGGISAGDGGDGQGGDVTFNLNGGNATVTNLTISANGFGGNGADGYIYSGTAGGDGGRGIGGNATFNAISGDLTITSTLSVSAEANGASALYGAYSAGGYGFGTDGGDGGDGIGGTATFNMTGTATINAGDIQVSTSATGGYGGTTFDQFFVDTTIIGGPAGSGGDATGGDTLLSDTSGTLTFGSASVESLGRGGAGGDNLGSYSGNADSPGGNGGIGRGGNATIDLNQDDPNSRVVTVDASATGGQGGYGSIGGNGGSAYGGVAAINVNDAAVDLDDPTILANATGGNGGQGRIDPTNDAGNSGNGGDATAGTARLQVTDAGGNIDLGFAILEANATGGNGAQGYYRFGGGINGGDGGSGGDATGGTVELIARTGGRINLTSGDFTMTSTGTGGIGGDGGYSYDSAAGDGGNGGDGTGGTGRLLAQGGTISGNDLNITTAGLGGDGGSRGYYGAFGTDGAVGVGGIGTGGTGIVEVQEGSPGILTFANVTMDSSGTGGGGPVSGFGAGGRIEITDSSTDPAGLISFDSLTATAIDSAIGTGIGSASALSGGFFMTGNSGAVSILGDLVVDVAGNIQYDLDGDAQMTVGGNATLTSGQDILIDHSNNLTAVNSIDVSGDFSATAQADFTSTSGSRINAAGTASVRTGQNAMVADIAGVGLVDISAMWNANVTNAAVTGTATTITLGAGTLVLGPQMLIQAGHDPMGTPSATFDPSYDATIDGAVTSTGFITVNAGGSALFSDGNSTVSDNGLTVRTGDDIIIQTGASLVAGNNAATSPNIANPFPDTNNLILQAGALTPLSSTTLTPIASIVAAGDIDANDFAVVMSANAIDGLGGTITASSVSADINDAPSNAVIASIGQSDDNGLLSGQCVEGNICLGTLNADNFVYIGQASNNDVVQGIIESGTVSANDILVTTRRDIIMGTDGIATVLDASNQFLVESTEGDVDLRDASVGSANIMVSAVNGSLLGSASLNSINDIGITVGADITAASVATGGQLTTVALVGGGSESLYTVPGSIKVDSYTQGTAQRFRVEAGNDIDFGQITVPDRAIELIAAQSGPGDVFLGTTSGASSIILQGENVGYIDLDSTVSAISGITILATNGDITGGNAVANFTTDLEAIGGDINIGDLTGGASGGTNLDASGSITVGALDGGVVINVNAGGDFNFDTAEAFRTNVNATNITGNTIRTLGVTGGAPNTLAMTASGDVTLGTATATDSLDLTVGGILAADLLDGNFLVDITAGAVDVTTLNAAQIGNVAATTGDLDIGAIVGGSSMRLESQTGDVILGTASTTNGFTAVANNGSIGFTDITAQGIGLTAGGDISGTSLSAINAGANQTIDLNAGGTASVGTLFANDIVDVDATIADFGTVTGTLLVRIEADDITTGNASSDGQVLLTAANGNISSGNLSGTAVQTQATGGNISTGDIDGTSILVRALNGNISTGNLTATGGGANDINVNAGGTAAVGSVTADRLVNIIGTAITGGAIDAGAFVDIDGTDISVGDVAAGDNLTIDATAGNVTTGALDAGLSIVVNASDSFDIASATNGNTTALRLTATNGSGTLGNVTSLGSIAIATGTDLVAGILDAATDITVISGGTPAIASVISGNDTTITGQSVTLNNGTIGGDLTLDASAGDIDGTGTVTVGGGIDLDATGNVGFGDLDAQGGTFTVDAGSDINFTGATSSDAINMTAGGGIFGGDLTATNALNLDGGTIAIGDANAGSINFSSATDILFDSIMSPASITLTATSGTIGANSGPGDITATDVGAGVNLYANDVAVGTLTTNSGDILVSAAQDIALAAAATGTGVPTAGSVGLLAGGNIAATGSLSAGEDVSIRALGNVALATVAAGDDFIVGSDGMISLDSATTSGAGIDLFALSFDTANAGQTGSIVFSSETSTGSNILLDGGGDIGVSGTLDANNDIFVTALGTPSIANVVSGNDTSITGSFVTLSSGSIGGDLTLSALAGDVDGSGSVTVGGGIDLDAAGDVGFGDLVAQGGTFTVDAGGNINFTSAASNSGTTLDAGGDIIGGDMTSDGDIAINGGGDASFGTVNSGANVRARLQGAFTASDVNAATTSQGEDEVDISADNGIDIANVAGNSIFLTAANGLVNVTNNVDVSNSIVASGEAVSIVTQQNMRVRADATNGNIDLSSAAGLEVDAAQATGDITMGAEDNVLINGTVSAANDLQISAGGTIDIQAATIGSTIQTLSADMNIGSAGSLGQRDLTSDIFISTDGTTQMRLGDETDLGGVFSLTNDEFSRIHSGGDLTINVAETGLSGFDLTIETLTASAFSNGNFGADGNFNISADQSINVIGSLSVQGDFNSSLNLAAGEDLFVNATTGSIGMRSDNSISGNLSLTARNIYAMTDQAFTDIQGMSTAEIDERLAQNDGNIRDDGFIVADAISVTLLASQFYVQNTGNGTDFDARRGFVAGTGGLSIDAGPSGVTPIVINGTVNGATGIDAIPVTTITGAGFDQQSTINGCVIANPTSCAPAPTPTPTPTPTADTPTLTDPVQDVIEEEVTPEESVADPLATNLIEIREIEDLAEEPLIDEPVTGAGNDDLWVGGAECERDDGRKCLVDDEAEELEPAE